MTDDEVDAERAQTVGILAAEDLRDGLPEDYGFVLLVFRCDGPGDGFAYTSHDEGDTDRILDAYRSTRRTPYTYRRPS